MVNSAIGDHGNERHHTSPTPPHPLISLPLPRSLPLSPILYELLCLGQDCGLCQARPDKKIETTPAPQPKTQNSKLSLWHLATYFSHPWLTFFFLFFFSVGNSHSACLFVFTRSNHYTLRLVDKTAIMYDFH